MFRRFRGLIDIQSNSHMRFFVMQIISPAILFGSALAATVLSAAVLAGTTAQAAGTAQEIGLWYDDTGDGAVKIEPCGGSLCGKIVWLKAPLHDDGTPLIDRHNPEPTKQKRTICGLQILGELKPIEGGGFDNGWVYDPKEGKSYSLAIRLTGKDQLEITGYLGVKLLGKTFSWTRAKTELPSCAAAVMPAAVPSDGKASDSKAGGTVGKVVGAAAGAATATAASSNAKATTPAKPAAAAAPSTTTTKKKASGGEVLPWGEATPANAAKPATTKSNLGASGVKPAAHKAKKAKPPVESLTQPRPATAVQ
jgi:uncharacterized protein (DUF2147 family)